MSINRVPQIKAFTPETYRSVILLWHDYAFGNSFEVFGKRLINKLAVYRSHYKNSQIAVDLAGFDQRFFITNYVIRNFSGWCASMENIFDPVDLKSIRGNEQPKILKKSCSELNGAFYMCLVGIDIFFTIIIRHKAGFRLIRN